MQLVLFYSGGLVIFNTKIRSIFASQNSNFEMHFDQSENVNNKIELVPIITSLAPAATATVITFATASILAIQNNAFFTIFGFIIGIPTKKKKKYWGIISDIENKKPIPFATIRLYKNESLITQATSDFEGRYSLLIAGVGDYIIDVGSSGYIPLHRTIKISASENDINEDFSLLNDRSLAINKIKFFFFYNRFKLLKYLRLIIYALFIIGLIYSLYAAYVSPLTINSIILVIYLLLVVYYSYIILKENRPKKGMVKDSSSKEPLKGVVVRIYSNRQLDVQISDQFGRIKFDLPAGDYLINASRSGYTFAGDSSIQLSGAKISFQKITINKNGEFDKDIMMIKTVEVMQNFTNQTLNNPFGK